MALKFAILEETEGASEMAAFHRAAFGGTREAALKNVTRQLRDGNVYVARRRGRIIATLILTPTKPWAIDTSYFTKVRVPLYLLGRAVAPALQRQGIGCRCLLEAERIAAAWPAQAIR